VESAVLTREGAEKVSDDESVMIMRAGQQSGDDALWTDRRALGGNDEGGGNLAVIGRGAVFEESARVHAVWHNRAVEGSTVGGDSGGGQRRCRQHRRRRERRHPGDTTEDVSGVAMARGIIDERPAAFRIPSKYSRPPDASTVNAA